VVQLVGVEQISSPLGGYQPRGKPLEVDTTDAAGNYNLSYNFQRGSTNFKLLQKSVNTPPVDTANLGIYPQTDGIILRNFYKNSTVYKANLTACLQRLC
jgi:hypothetical protein